MTPDLSLIICTHNRASMRRQCLQVLTHQRYNARRWELIIVENACTDDTSVVVAEIEGHLAYTFVREPRIGQARARNAGVRAAKAPILAFTDDDCYVSTDYVERMLDAFRCPTIGYVGGQV